MIVRLLLVRLNIHRGMMNANEQHEQYVILLRCLSHLPQAPNPLVISRVT
jgi:hypothetical protein